jgi:hypothetical protein
MFSETQQRRKFVNAATTRQELRPPFKVPQMIFREPDRLVGSTMILQRRNPYTVSMAQVICW